ncbi:MAG: hypothetical protein GY810_31390 [Aureispira sp.]|nr:hypothetical protein [Aureispira sp.]
MRILEDDFKCGQYWLEYSPENMDDFSTFNNEIINSFFLFTQNFIVPYSVNVSISTFDSYWFPDETFAEYHLTLDKPHIKTSIDRTGAIEKTVSEISAQEIEKLLFNIQQQSNTGSLIGISRISCLAGLYFLPKKTKDTTFVLYTGSGGANHSKKKRPIFEGIGIEAPLSTFGDIWAPIEVFFEHGYENIELKLILNWDLYSKHNKQGFLMLKKALEVLIRNSWKNEMPKDIFS